MRLLRGTRKDTASVIARTQSGAKGTRQSHPLWRSVRAEIASATPRNDGPWVMAREHRDRSNLISWTSKHEIASPAARNDGPCVMAREHRDRSNLISWVGKGWDCFACGSQ